MTLSDKKPKNSIGFGYAWNGLMELWRTETNFKIHCAACIVVIIISFLLRLSAVEWTIVFIAIGIVFITEIFNTTVERMIDYIKPNIHPLAGVIKDIAAGGVFIAAIMSAIIGFLIFLPKILALF